MGLNWNRLAEMCYDILSDSWKDNTKLTGEFKLSVLDAQLEVINAEANNILGTNHFVPVTERSDVAHEFCQV